MVVFVLEGAPGVGKTTVMGRIEEALKKQCLFPCAFIFGQEDFLTLLAKFDNDVTKAEAIWTKTVSNYYTLYADNPFVVVVLDRGLLTPKIFQRVGASGVSEFSTDLVLENRPNCGGVVLHLPRPLLRKRVAARLDSATKIEKQARTAPLVEEQNDAYQNMIYDNYQRAVDYINLKSNPCSNWNVIDTSASVEEVVEEVAFYICKLVTPYVEWTRDHPDLESLKSLSKDSITKIRFIGRKQPHKLLKHRLIGETQKRHWSIFVGRK